MARHINPTESGQTAMAPYNFVPLPERVFTVKQPGDKKEAAWETHDQFRPDRHSGWIELQIQPLTPLFIRGAVRRDNQKKGWDERDSRLRPEPFTDPEGRPVLPGSSLRGMVRTLVEILSFSKLTPITAARPFFRTVGDDRLGRAYRDRMLRGNEKPPGGFLRRQGHGWEIRPAEVRRVPRELLTALHFRNNPSYTPDWRFQHHRCHVRLDRGSLVSEIRIQEPSPGAGWTPGTLVLTGSSPKKRKEFVLLDPTPGAQPIPVPELAWKRFHDEDQISQWQQKAYPRDQPTRGCRAEDGALRDGEPVFYLCDASQPSSEDNPAGLVFLGRPQMFRLPYDLGPRDLVPKELRPAELDLAETLFGRVRQERGDPLANIKGRLRFEDAPAEGAGPDWLEPVLVPELLSSPKPTAFQQYLTQDGRRGKEALGTYLHGDGSQVRGHKLYWHRWEEGQRIPQHANQEALLRDWQQGRLEDTQCTVIQPVRASTRFRGRIHFHNLTDLELGALLAALELPEGCAHKLGMAKPLGFGSVRITPRLHLIDPAARYASWSHPGDVAEAEQNARAARCRQAFADTMLQHARAAGEVTLPSGHGLRSLARLDALFTLLSWEERPPREDTRYLKIQDGDGRRYRADGQGKVNEYRDRPVLPTPRGVVGKPEPLPPPPGGELPRVPPRGPDRPFAGRERSPARPGGGPGKPPAAPAPPARPASTEPAVGSRVRCVVLEEKTKKGGWKFRVLSSSHPGVLHPASPVPEGLEPGRELELEVVAGGATLQLKWKP